MGFSPRNHQANKISPNELYFAASNGYALFTNSRNLPLFNPKAQVVDTPLAGIELYVQAGENNISFVQQVADERSGETPAFAEELTPFRIKQSEMNRTLEKSLQQSGSRIESLTEVRVVDIRDVLPSGYDLSTKELRPINAQETLDRVIALYALR